MTFSRHLRMSWLIVGIETFQNNISDLGCPADTYTGPKGGASYVGSASCQLILGETTTFVHSAVPCPPPLPGKHPRRSLPPRSLPPARPPARRSPRRS